MCEIKASEFKAKCLKLLDEVAETGEPIIVTKNGKPVARLEPHQLATPRSLFGILKGQIEFVDPDDDLSTWDEETRRAVEESLEKLARDVEPLSEPTTKR